MIFRLAVTCRQGRCAPGAAVVNHYDQLFGLGLSDQQKSDLIEYLKSL
jgi:hypothetical protein